MFSKGIMRDGGIDITLKNNPDHILAPDDWNMVMGVKLKKISLEEYVTWYKNLIITRWETRRQEFIDLAQKGMGEDIKLKCFCPNKDKGCHAYYASKFMNKLVALLQKKSSKD